MGTTRDDGSQKSMRVSAADLPRDLLIRGLRQLRVHKDDNWLKLTSAIQGKWPALTASESTREAETGLGITGRPYYFYVLRSEENFSFVVFVLSEKEEAEWPSDARGATPFDSGGLWLKKIATSPKLDDAGRRDFFQSRDVPLKNWRSAFEEYVRTRYKTVSDYVRGDAPELATEEQNSPPTIIMGDPNGRLAWTWEVRVPHALIAGRLTLQAAWMTEDDLVAYLYWLWDDKNPLPANECSRIQEWIDKCVITITITPEHETSVAQAVEDWLVVEFTDA